MKSKSPRKAVWRKALALLLFAGLIAAACGSDSDDTETTAPAVETPDETDAGSDDAPGSEEPAADPGEAEPTAPTEPAEEIVLTDSFRGVTSEKITLGYTSIDFDQLNELFGLDLAFENYSSQADAIVAMYNERGGVLGRQIELVHVTYLPTGSTSADEACTRLTQDEEVFAVLGGFAGPGAVEVNPCISELNDTILVGPPARQDQAEASGGLWVSSSMNSDRRNVALVSLLSQAGALEELGTVMVIGSAPEELPLVESLAADLEAAGVDVAVSDVVSTIGDRAATSAAVEVWIERARSEGVSSVVLLGEDKFRNEDFFVNAPEFTYVVGNGDTISDWQNTAPEGLQPGTRVLSNNVGSEESELADPAMADCVAAVERGLGVEMVTTSQVAEGETDYWAGTTGACRTIALFVQIAEAAGPDLTNDSWVAALDQIPDLSLPGYAFASISSTKIDARDQLVLIEYDLETMSFVELTPAVDVG